MEMTRVNKKLLNNNDINFKESKRTILYYLKKEKYVYYMLIPVILYYIIFHYLPMIGLFTAFQDFSLAPSKGFFKSPWVGFKHFADFFNGPYFFKTVKNSVLLSLSGIVFSFPAPILLALLLNEIRMQKFKSLVQTVTYIPHFISLVVVVGFITEFFSSRGAVNTVIQMLGGGRVDFLIDNNWFRPLFIGSGIWQEAGWGSIIYLSAIAAIDPSMYESSKMDGAGRLKQLLHITIPCIMPTIIVLLILRMGRIMGVAFEKVLLMYNPAIYETADVIKTYVYRRGMLDRNYSFAAAVDLFNSVINFTFLIASNKLSKKITDSGLW